MTGLPNSPVSRKRPAEVFSSLTYFNNVAFAVLTLFAEKLYPSQDSPSSGDSTATKLPPMKINPGCVFSFAPSLFSTVILYLTSLLPRGLAKQRKVDEPEAAPVVQKPEKAKPDIPVPLFERTETGEETPADDPQLHESAGDDPAAPMIPPSPALQTPKTPIAECVTLTGAGYCSPSHVLTRHSEESKEKSPERIDFDFPSLEKMSTDDLHAGYLNRLNSSHNMERKLVGLMKSKFEVLPLFSPFLMLLCSPQEPAW